AGSARAGTRFGPMPITTSSSAALALFNEGRRLGEAYERGVAVATLEKAIELDPDFALARCFLAIFTESPEEGDAQVRAAAKLAQAGRTSDGEKLFIEAHLAGFDGNDTLKAAKLAELAKLYADDWRP